MSDRTDKTRITVPVGFRELLGALCREILRHQPKNIIEFSALYFEQKLRDRDGGSRPILKRPGNRDMIRQALDSGIISSEVEDMAALKIQSVYRGHRARCEVQQLRAERGLAASNVPGAVCEEIQGGFCSHTYQRRLLLTSEATRRQRSLADRTYKAFQALNDNFSEDCSPSSKDSVPFAKLEDRTQGHLSSDSESSSSTNTNVDVLPSTPLRNHPRSSLRSPTTTGVQALRRGFRTAHSSTPNSTPRRQRRKKVCHGDSDGGIGDWGIERGRPLSPMRIYLLDEQHRLQPLDVIRQCTDGMVLSVLRPPTDFVVAPVFPNYNAQNPQPQLSSSAAALNQQLQNVEDRTVVPTGTAQTGPIPPISATTARMQAPPRESNISEYISNKLKPGTVEGFHRRSVASMRGSRSGLLGLGSESSDDGLSHAEGTPGPPPNTPVPSLSDYSSKTKLELASSESTLPRSQTSLLLPPPPPNTPVTSLSDACHQQPDRPFRMFRGNDDEAQKGKKFSAPEVGGFPHRSAEENNAGIVRWPQQGMSPTSQCQRNFDSQQQEPRRNTPTLCTQCRPGTQQDQQWARWKSTSEIKLTVKEADQMSQWLQKQLNASELRQTVLSSELTLQICQWLQGQLHELALRQSVDQSAAGTRQVGVDLQHEGRLSGEKVEQVGQWLQGQLQLSAERVSDESQQQLPLSTETVDQIGQWLQSQIKLSAEYIDQTGQWPPQKLQLSADAIGQVQPLQQYQTRSTEKVEQVGQWPKPWPRTMQVQSQPQPLGGESVRKACADGSESAQPVFNFSPEQVEQVGEWLQTQLQLSEQEVDEVFVQLTSDQIEQVGQWLKQQIDDSAGFAQVDQQSTLLPKKPNAEQVSQWLQQQLKLSAEKVEKVESLPKQQLQLSAEQVEQLGQWLQEQKQFPTLSTETVKPIIQQMRPHGKLPLGSQSSADRVATKQPSSQSACQYVEQWPEMHPAPTDVDPKLEKWPQLETDLLSKKMQEVAQYIQKQLQLSAEKIGARTVEEQWHVEDSMCTCQPTATPGTRWSVDEPPCVCSQQKKVGQCGTPEELQLSVEKITQVEQWLKDKIRKSAENIERAGQLLKQQKLPASAEEMAAQDQLHLSPEEIQFIGDWIQQQLRLSVEGVSVDPTAEIGVWLLQKLRLSDAEINQVGQWVQYKLRLSADSISQSPSSRDQRDQAGTARLRPEEWSVETKTTGQKPDQRLSAEQVEPYRKPLRMQTLSSRERMTQGEPWQQESGRQFGEQVGQWPEQNLLEETIGVWPAEQGQQVSTLVQLQQSEIPSCVSEQSDKQMVQSLSAQQQQMVGEVQQAGSWAEQTLLAEKQLPQKTVESKPISSWSQQKQWPQQQRLSKERISQGRSLTEEQQQQQQVTSEQEMKTEHWPQQPLYGESTQSLRSWSQAQQPCGERMQVPLQSQQTLPGPEGKSPDYLSQQFMGETTQPISKWPQQQKGSRDRMEPTAERSHWRVAGEMVEPIDAWQQQQAVAQMPQREYSGNRVEPGGLWTQQQDNFCGERTESQQMQQTCEWVRRAGTWPQQQLSGKEAEQPGTWQQQQDNSEKAKQVGQQFPGMQKETWAQQQQQLSGERVKQQQVYGETLPKAGQKPQEQLSGIEIDNGQHAGQWQQQELPGEQSEQWQQLPLSSERKSQQGQLSKQQLNRETTIPQQQQVSGEGLWKEEKLPQQQAVRERKAPLGAMLQQPLGERVCQEGQLPQQDVDRERGKPVSTMPHELPGDRLSKTQQLLKESEPPSRTYSKEQEEWRQQQQLGRSAATHKKKQQAEQQPQALRGEQVVPSALSDEAEEITSLKLSVEQIEQVGQWIQQQLSSETPSNMVTGELNVNGLPSPADILQISADKIGQVSQFLQHQLDLSAENVDLFLTLPQGSLEQIEDTRLWQEMKKKSLIEQSESAEVGKQLSQQSGLVSAEEIVLVEQFLWEKLSAEKDEQSDRFSLGSGGQLDLSFAELDQVGEWLQTQLKLLSRKVELLRKWAQDQYKSSLQSPPNSQVGHRTQPSAPPRYLDQAPGRSYSFGEADRNIASNQWSQRRQGIWALNTEPSLQAGQASLQQSELQAEESKSFETDMDEATNIPKPTMQRSTYETEDRWERRHQRLRQQQIQLPRQDFEHYLERPSLQADDDVWLQIRRQQLQGTERTIIDTWQRQEAQPVLEDNEDDEAMFEDALQDIHDIKDTHIQQEVRIIPRSTGQYEQKAGPVEDLELQRLELLKIQRQAELMQLELQRREFEERRQLQDELKRTQRMKELQKLNALERRTAQQLNLEMISQQSSQTPGVLRVDQETQATLGQQNEMRSLLRRGWRLMTFQQRIQRGVRDSTGQNLLLPLNQINVPSWLSRVSRTMMDTVDLIGRSGSVLLQEGVNNEQMNERIRDLATYVTEIIDDLLYERLAIPILHAPRGAANPGSSILSYITAESPSPSEITPPPVIRQTNTERPPLPTQVSNRPPSFADHNSVVATNTNTPAVATGSSTDPMNSNVSTECPLATTPGGEDESITQTATSAWRQISPTSKNFTAFFVTTHHSPHLPTHTKSKPAEELEQTTLPASQTPISLSPSPFPTTRLSQLTTPIKAPILYPSRPASASPKSFTSSAASASITPLCPTPSSKTITRTPSIPLPPPPTVDNCLLSPSGSAASSLVKRAPSSFQSQNQLSWDRNGGG